MSTDRRLVLARILALVLVIAVSVYVFSIRDRAEELAVYGYPGIFLISILANATVLLPAPGVALVFALGGVFPPLGVAFAAGAGAAVGELSGYLAGFSGQPILANAERYQRIVRLDGIPSTPQLHCDRPAGFYPKPIFRPGWDRRGRP